jgi:hypothetical protein
MARSTAARSRFRGVVVRRLLGGQVAAGWFLVRGGRAGALVAAVADHAGAAGRVVTGPAFGDTGDEERGGVVAGSGYRVTHVGDPAVEVGDDLHVLPGHVFSCRRTGRGSPRVHRLGRRPVDQHTRTLGPVVPLVDLGAVHPPQDRLQDLLLAGHRGLRTAEHLAQHVVGHVVPQPEQHRDDRLRQRQDVRPADRRVRPRATTSRTAPSTRRVVPHPVLSYAQPAAGPRSTSTQR